MPEDNLPDTMFQSQGEDLVSSSWQEFVQILLGLFLLISALFMARYYAPPPSHELQQKVQQLSEQVQRLQQQEAVPSAVLGHYRNSICYIFGIYQVAFPNRAPSVRVRVSGTGFVVAKNLLATNRHVAEPWYEDPETEALIERGAVPQLEKLVAFFPGSPTPVEITPAELSDSDDLAVVRVTDSAITRSLVPLPLASESSSPGDPVAVVGYPMGILGMVAKSPAAVYDRLAYRHDDANAASELAALSLIRPSATYGHLGDVVGEKLIYDAPTAHGGSGGPVFNSRGEVIGVNSAYIDGFSGGTLGISSKALRPLIQAALKSKPFTVQITAVSKK